LLENVPGFLTAHGGRDFCAALAELARRGYWLDAFLVDARWFVPQSRPRLFVVGYHAELPAPVVRRRTGGDAWNCPWRRAVDRAPKLRTAGLRALMEQFEPHTGWAAVEAPNPDPVAYRLDDYLDLDATQDWWDEADVQRHLEMTSERHLRQLELHRERSDPTLLTGFRRVRHGAQRLEVRFDGIAGCLRTPRGGSAKQIVIAVGRGRVRMRWMTPREYARLQGAPDYRLPGNSIQALFGFGDAVCVPAIRWIDQHMLTPAFEGWAAAHRASQESPDARPVHAG
jgi:DNA (cytosine-5)-methyltransferase 1